MKRRDFLRKAGMVGLGLVAAPAVVSALPKPKPKPPYFVPISEYADEELAVGEIGSYDGNRNSGELDGVRIKIENSAGFEGNLFVGVGKKGYCLNTGVEITVPFEVYEAISNADIPHFAYIS